MRLMREVRFRLNAEVAAGPVLNSWAGWPSGDTIAPFVVLRAWVRGPVDPRTGLRERAIPHLQRAWTGAQGQSLPAAEALAGLWELLADRFPEPASVESLHLGISPYLSLAAFRGELPMIVMTESFEFAAAHRLYCADLGDEENERVFGKCANPNGHGHNYVVEVGVCGQPDVGNGTIVDHAAFQRTVKQQVIERFDHKHLNQDCPQFARLNPTVENITRVIWDLLVDRFTPARLHSVRVWETPKTCAEYHGE
ncbi:MAG: 6-pyruvoyl trahydropterin synthase family protein [Planctomycetota bacterium]|jgi:6-pyruvoyltetrahydropterin/6-carboxytetrahydropterin synthase